MRKVVKMTAGGYRIPVELEITDARIFFHFRYNADLISEVKKMEGRKYHGFDDINPRKVWSIPITPRNVFTIEYLCAADGMGPYKKWKEDCPLLTFDRSLMTHQQIGCSQWWHKRQFLMAWEMGTGKTLAALTVIERIVKEFGVEAQDIWWVGTVSSLRSTEVELDKWKFGFRPVMLTYDRMRIDYGDGDIPRLPQIIVFDECSRLKTPTAARTLAAMHITGAMRSDSENLQFILGMTGSPAPKSPVDWWSQCEVVCPGFLAESSAGALTQRLAVIEQVESEAGGVFPKIVAWRDREDLCSYTWEEKTQFTDDSGKEVMRTRTCCATADLHKPDIWGKNIGHPFKKGINEVEKLYRRMRGLVEVKFSKDCLDLPEMWQDFVILPPTKEQLQLARLIARTAPRAVTALAQLRELSDGFQYEEVPNGIFSVCKECNGSRKIVTMQRDDFGNPIENTQVEYTCSTCNEEGKVEGSTREAKYLGSPKETRLVEDLELNEEIGRLVVYSAFTGTIDIVQNVCQKAGWGVIRADGRGWIGYNEKGEKLEESPTDLLKLFSSGQGKYVFNGHPGAAGMGISLTAAATLVWYSLPFNAEEYIQARKRIHRAGMDVSRGATERFYFHLGSDKMVFENLTGKLDLAAISMGEVQEALNG